MSRIREGLLLPERRNPQLDEELFEKRQAIQDGSSEIYTQLAVSSSKKEGIVDAWRKGVDHELLADHNDVSGLLEKKDQLDALRNGILHDEEIDDAARDAYVWKIEEDIANATILIASAIGDMNLFKEANESIYGRPDEDIYRGAIDWIVNDAEELLAVEGQHESVRTAAENVINLLGEKRGYRELLMPESGVFERVRQDHMRPLGYYGLLLDGVEVPAGKITREIGDPILERVVRNLGSKKKIADASGASWSVSHEKNALLRPAEYNMPAKRFIGLGLGHEIGSHELEHANGSRGPLKLLKLGLDRYELGNEGRAVIREQVPYQSFNEFMSLPRWRDILRRHIAISYATGVGEDGPQSSSDVYKLMNVIDTMYQTKLNPDDSELAQSKAANKTETLLLRVLKGTDGKGGAYLKDKVYLEGHVACWLTAAMKGAPSISDGDLGKFDINNPRHIQLLLDLGLLPEADEE